MLSFISREEDDVFEEVELVVLFAEVVVVVFLLSLVLLLDATLLSFLPKFARCLGCEGMLALLITSLPLYWLLFVPPQEAKNRVKKIRTRILFMTNSLF